MEGSSTWQPWPLGRTLAQNKDELALQPHELAEMRDLEAITDEGGLSLRRGHERVFPETPSMDPAVRVVDCAAVRRTTAGIGELIVLGTRDGGAAEDHSARARLIEDGSQWVDLLVSANTQNRNYLPALGTGEVDIIAELDQVRTFGTGLGWRGEITFPRKYDAAGRPISQYLFTNRPLYLTGHPGAEYHTPEVPWTAISAPNEIRSDDLAIQTTTIRIDPVANGYGYGNQRNVYHAFAILFEGGQESPLTLLSRSFINLGEGTAGRISLHLYVPSIFNFPFRAKRIKIYSAQSANPMLDPLKEGTFFLVREIGIYEDKGERQNGDGAGWVSVNEVQAQSDGSYMVIPGGIWGPPNEHHFFVGGDQTQLWFSVEGHPTVEMQCTNIVLEDLDGWGMNSLKFTVAPAYHALIREYFAGNMKRGVRFFHKWDIYLNAVTPETVQDAHMDIVDGGQYLTASYDSQTKMPQSTQYINPPRRHARFFSDQAYYWNVTDEEGKTHLDRLYHDHVNGFGIRCKDVVLPLAYVPMPFRILDVRQLGSARVVIGDKGYAVGIVSGTSRNWKIIRDRVDIGCESAQSIADTPIGPVMLGWDGFYRLSAEGHGEPFGQEFYYEIQRVRQLANVTANYGRNGSYYVHCPGLDPYVLKLPDMHLRQITAPGQFPLQVLIPDINSWLLSLTRDDVFRLEAKNNCEDDTTSRISGAMTPAPRFANGYFRFVEGEAYQKIIRLDIHYECNVPLLVTITGYRFNQSYEALLPARSGRGGYVLNFDMDQFGDERHRLTIVPQGTPKVLFLGRIMADVLPVNHRTE